MVGMAGNEQGHDLLAELDAFLAEHAAELIEFRRDLHAHPELGYHEHRTTRRGALRLAAAGPRPGILPKGTGMLGGLRTARDGPLVALRAGLDALPLSAGKQGAYASHPPPLLPECG